MTVMYATEPMAAGRACLKARKAGPRLAAGLEKIGWTADAADVAAQGAKLAETCGLAADWFPGYDVILACRALADSRKALLECMKEVRGPKSAFVALEDAAGRQPGLRTVHVWSLARLREALDEVHWAASLFAGGERGWKPFLSACARAGVWGDCLLSDDIDVWAGEIGLDAQKFLRRASGAAEQASEATAAALADYEGFCCEFKRYFGALPGRRAYA
ncbi:MAG: hypothetical protein LBQ12_06215 [Deltaproteobacteria bacterium]|jgi:hypothetical protein|nr:hypothetical protein [Deltaproteobacteria bacterium]